MEGLSEELNAIFFEGKEKEFHDVVLEMLKSLDMAQDTVRKAYFLALGKDKAQKGFRGSGGGP